MIDKSKFDFGGYATRYNTLCSDGRKIVPKAFEHSNGAKLPLVWQHLHDTPTNILGHVMLEDREDGVYVYGRFNGTEAGKNAKALVQAEDIIAMSIYANQLVEKNKIVHSGMIREVSLVLSGANPGATIDHINMQHSDGSEIEVEDEAVIYSGETLETNLDQKKEDLKHEDEEVLEHVDGESEETVGDVINTLNEKQKTAVYAILTKVIEGDDDEGKDLEQSEEEGETFMKQNVFEKKEDEVQPKSLTHAQIGEILNTAKKVGSLKEAVLAHAGTYGIDDIGYLFPDAKTVTNEPELYTRDQSWVGAWMSGTRHTPFSRIKSMYADITPDAARAKGYVTGNLKVEEVFAILKRTTDPTTIYKKQKLDRDDVLDITDFNVVSWLKNEMRMMLDEEIARACLVGDGRSVASDDHVDATKIRPIYGDAAIYSHLVTLEATVTDYGDIIDAMILARKNYKGKGMPTMFCSSDVLTNMLLLKDTTDRRIYKSVQELASELRVSNIVEVDVFDGVTRVDAAPFTADLLAILVNPRDYVIGADKGAALGMFDDFDIDYNQYKYLIETRISGALISPKTALVFERKQA